MGRKRSRSHSSGSTSRPSSSSSSSSSSYSSSSEDEEERSRREREREEQERNERKARKARKAEEKAAAKAAAEKAKDELNAREAAGNLTWHISIPLAENEVEEDPLEVCICAKAPVGVPAGVVDAMEWEKLEVYLRKTFMIDASIKKLRLKVAVVLNGQNRFYGQAVDFSTLMNVHSQIARLGRQLLDASEVKVVVSLGAACIGKKLKAPSKARTRNQESSTAKFNELKASIYGSTGSGNSYVNGEWTVESSDIMPREHDFMEKFDETRRVAEKVMGDADYHPNPCVLICPFATCKKGHRQLNGVCAISQLYSHWQKNHAENPASAVLEARWRLALDNKGKSAEWLDDKHPLILSDEEMQSLGGEDAGYEKVRRPVEDATDFKYYFALHTDEHREWLNAKGTI